ncbi:MAG: glutamate synthase subunit alpha, partial [Pseudomonadota bacterium]
MTNGTPSNSTLVPLHDAASQTPATISKKRNSAGGLYDPRNEHDACGLGFIANMKGNKSHKIVQDGLRILENLEHRGATGADPLMGDGAGMLVQIPHDFFVAECAALDITLPAVGDYGIGFFFMPQDEDEQARIKAILEGAASDEGVPFLGWRKVPVNNAGLSQDPEIAASEPVHWQGFFGRPEGMEDEDYERRLYLTRRVLSNRVIAARGLNDDFYAVSLSSRTIVYKGMFLADQLGPYY